METCPLLVSPTEKVHKKCVVFVSFLESGPPCITTTTGGWCHLHERSIFASGTRAQQHASKTGEWTQLWLACCVVAPSCCPLWDCCAAYIPSPSLSLSLIIKLGVAGCVLFASGYSCSLSLSLCLTRFSAWPAPRGRRILCALHLPHPRYPRGAALISWSRACSSPALSKALLLTLCTHYTLTLS